MAARAYLKACDGGAIVYLDAKRRPIRVQRVRACKHTDVKDDYMGGAFCGSCRKHW